MEKREEINRALQETSIAYTGMSGEAEVFILAEEKSMMIALREVELIMKKVIQSDQVLYKVDLRVRGEGLWHIGATKLGALLADLLRLDVDAIFRCFPSCQFNPYFVAFAGYSQREGLRFWMELDRARSYNETTKLVFQLNRFVDAVRKEGRGYRFKKRMDNFERSARKNYKSLTDYIDELFAVHSKLLVLRIDLAYAQEYGARAFDRNSLPYHEVRGHRENFVRTLPRYLEQKLSKSCLVGFAWKLEYGLKKSWHYHVMIMLNGQVIREDITLGRLIGEHWMAITQGKGVYYNCNAYKGRYKSLGIGLIGHRDERLREGLKKAALYMTKTDYYVKVLAPDKGRTFGKGGKPKLKPKRPGRPRFTYSQILESRHALKGQPKSHSRAQTASESAPVLSAAG